MIKTIDYDKIPATVLHKITGDIDVEEVKNSMAQAYEIVHKAITSYGRFNFIIDARGLNFTEEAHLLWKQKIEDEPQFKEKMNYMVFVLDYSAKARAAKKRRDSENTQFFYNFDDGINWLLNKVSNPKQS